MTNTEVEKMLLENGLEGAIYFTDFNYGEAIIGYADNDRIVYSYNLMVESLVKNEGMDEDEAMEWIDYNTARAVGYMGANAPIIMYDIMK